MNSNDRINPPRFVDTEDIGPLLRRFDASQMDEARLAQNRAALPARFAAECSVQGRFGAESLFQRRRLALAVFLLFLLMSAGAAAVIYVRVFSAPSAAAEDSEPTVAPKRSPKKERNAGAPVSESLTEQEHLTEIPAPDAGAEELGPSSKPQKSVSSTLDAQVRLFSKAKQQIAAGDFEAGLRDLKRLRQRYPNSPLKLEADELQARALAGLHRNDEAARVVRRLIRADVTTRKKARLYRFLGDLQRKQNRCDEAAASYGAALGLGLSDAESQAAAAGIQRCSK